MKRINRLVYLLVAGAVVAAIAHDAAWSQGREVNCDRVPSNPLCAREPVPAHAGQATVPGSNSLAPVDVQTTYAAPVRAGEPTPAHGAVATIPGSTPPTPVHPQQ